MPTEIKLAGGKTLLVKEDLNDNEIEDFVKGLFPAPDERDRALEFGNQAIEGFRELQAGLIDVAKRPERDYTGVFTSMLRAMEAMEKLQPQTVDSTPLLKVLIEAVNKIGSAPSGDQSNALALVATALERLSNRELPTPQINVESPAIDLSSADPVGYDVDFKRDGSGALQGVRMIPLRG